MSDREMVKELIEDCESLIEKFQKGINQDRVLVVAARVLLVFAGLAAGWFIAMLINNFEAHRLLYPILMFTTGALMALTVASAKQRMEWSEVRIENLTNHLRTLHKVEATLERAEATKFN